MLKKLASLLLSLLLCLSLLPGQARAADVPEDLPPIQTESLEAARPDDPDDPDGQIMPLGEDLPEEELTKHNGE